MADFKFKSVLVTGAAGFIGCNFVRKILKKNPEIKVISFDLLTYAGSRKNLEDILNSSNYPNHIFIQGDICDGDKIKEILEQFEIDLIVHFAAESHVDNSISGPEIFIKTNVLGTFNLLECARQYWLEKKHWNQDQCRFHHVSTDEVFGSLNKTDPGFNERTPYAPNSPYSASKASSDHLVRAYSHTYGLPVTISNCSNNFGPYQHAEKLIPVVIKSCVDQKNIPIYGDGSNIRDWLFVEDHCEAIERILISGIPGESYNIGGNCELSNLDLVKKICDQMDVLIPEQAPHRNLISFVKDRQGHDWRYAIDSSKIKNQLGWEANHNFDQMLARTLKYYLSLIRETACEMV